MSIIPKPKMVNENNTIIWIKNTNNAILANKWNFLPLFTILSLTEYTLRQYDISYIELYCIKLSLSIASVFIIYFIQFITITNNTLLDSLNEIFKDISIICKLIFISFLWILTVSIIGGLILLSTLSNIEDNLMPIVDITSQTLMNIVCLSVLVSTRFSFVMNYLIYYHHYDLNKFKELSDLSFELNPFTMLINVMFIILIMVMALLRIENYFVNFTIMFYIVIYNTEMFKTICTDNNYKKRSKSKSKITMPLEQCS